MLKNKSLFFKTISVSLLVIFAIFVTFNFRNRPSISKVASEISTVVIPEDGAKLLDYDNEISEVVSQNQIKAWEVVANLDILFAKSVSEFYFNFDDGTGYKIKRDVNFLDDNCSPESCDWRGKIITEKCDSTSEFSASCKQIYLSIREGQLVYGEIPGEHSRFNKNFVYKFKYSEDTKKLLLIAFDLSNFSGE